MGNTSGPRAAPLKLYVKDILRHRLMGNISEVWRLTAILDPLRNVLSMVDSSLSWYEDGGLMYGKPIEMSRSRVRYLLTLCLSGRSSDGLPRDG